MHEAGDQTHAYLLEDVRHQPDQITAVCGRGTWAVMLINIPMAPFCEACVSGINDGSPKSEGYS